MRDRRIGRFAISRKTVELDPDAAREVMSHCIVIRCEMMYAYNTLEYMAICPEFDEVGEGEIAPVYDVIIHGGGSVEFKRSNVELRGASSNAAQRPVERSGTNLSAGLAGREVET